ncbi:hypothetical protein ABZ942_23705 [Nocardia sp. NPDC046473]|uniref:hypothetical protein n=1 Tax=Nocardia sp. NPDC046473 TaxID=3155733 RepID=UPI0033F632AA
MVNRRAVVLGPGGVVGTAWSLGVVEGLRRNRIELADADLLVGASAGADGVPVHRVVTASTAMPGMAAPVTIGAHRYIDGAPRNGSNADLAEGMSTLILIEPLAHVFPTTVPSSVRRVARIVPDPVAIETFGPDLDDRSSWPAVFAAGLRQGKAAADEVRAVWQ